ncbi:MAG: ATP-binding cassette domain-containing protein, partial [Alphaproteobacteria bacterium]
LDHASVSLPAGHRIGFVGRNGTGKTTLLSLILGQIQPEAGEITMPRRSRIGTVAQRLPDPRLTPREMVLAGDAERARLMAQADDQSNPLAAADAHARLVETGAHAAPAQAARILAGLGFDEAAQARPLAEYSGGWRMRAALAAALFAEPDLLLLDEPTNHLDLEAALWLEGHLARYPHTVLMVSHDRRLLERATDRTLLLEGGKLKLYGGGFSVFERIRREERLTVGREAERVAKAKAHMEAFVERFRYKASKARQAQSRLKALEKLGDPTPLVEAGDVRFDFPQPRPLSPPILALDDVSVGYGGKPVLEHLSLRLEPDDRVALLGANGNGKTTLARLLAG